MILEFYYTSISSTVSVNTGWSFQKLKIDWKIGSKYFATSSRKGGVCFAVSWIWNCPVTCFGQQISQKWQLGTDFWGLDIWRLHNFHCHSLETCGCQVRKPGSAAGEQHGGEWRLPGQLPHLTTDRWVMLYWIALTQKATATWATLGEISRRATQLSPAKTAEFCTNKWLLV
jgi:hypothetical protein